MKPSAPLLFEGCGTALVTPMRGGDIDKDAFTALVTMQIEEGADALIVCGTTGESPTLTDCEKEWLFSEAVRVSHGSRRRIPVIAGTGSNNTARAVELSRLAESCGCDGLLVVTPYYNKASECGLVRHYETVADAVSIPLIAYHVPARTGCKMSLSACRELACHPRVAGLKDATGDLSFAAHVASECGDSLPLYAGCDDVIVPLLSVGGRGVISVVSNLLPALVSRLCRLWRDGKATEATREQLALLTLNDALFSDVNPIPVKYALSCLGLCSEELRLPLTPADSRTRAQIRRAMGAYGLL